MEPKIPNGNQPSKRPRDKPRQEQKYHDDKHTRSMATNQSAGNPPQRPTGFAVNRLNSNATGSPQSGNSLPTLRSPLAADHTGNRQNAILQQPTRSAKTSDAGATAGSGTDVARDLMPPPRRNAQDPQVAAAFGSSLRDVTRFAGGAATNPLYGSPGRYGPSSLQSDQDALAHYLRKLPPR